VKRFQFPLERVLRWRAGQASVEELKLRQLLDETRRLESVRRGLESDVKAAESRVLAGSSIEAIELTSLGSYRLHARRKIRDLDKLRLEQQAKIVDQRQRVMEARRHSELLERLRGKTFEEWRSAVNREQETLAAELFLAKPRRNNR